MASSGSGWEVCINDLPDDVICNIAIYSDDTTCCCKYDQVSDLWCNNQNWLLNLNQIYNTLEWSRKWLVDFNAGKTQLVSFDWSNTGAIDVKMNGSVLEEKSSLKDDFDAGVDFLF